MLSAAVRPFVRKLKSGAHSSYGIETAALPIGMVVIVLRAVTPSAVSEVMVAPLRNERAMLLPVGEMHVVMRTQRLRQNLEAVFLRIVEALVQGLLSVGEFNNWTALIAGGDAMQGCRYDR
jgi:hypothetical protein